LTTLTTLTTLTSLTASFRVDGDATLSFGPRWFSI
jgi:hypothetical protein